MFGWFNKSPVCPVEPEVQDWVDRRWDWLLVTMGRDIPRAAQVVLPTRHYFPDAYDSTDPVSIRRLFDRVSRLMGLDPLRFESKVFSENKSPVRPFAAFRPEFAGAAGLYERDGIDCTIWVEERQLDDPLRLVATLAHELAHDHLLGREFVTERVEDHEPLTDLMVVYRGLGVIAANSVVQESVDRMGAYGWSSVSRTGYLDMRTFGYALAHFATLRGEDRPRWGRELRPDVRDALEKGLRFLTSRAAETGGP